MKKLKKIIVALLIMSFLASPMYLTLRVHATSAELSMSRISDTLKSVMSNSTEEKIDVMIWLNDTNASAVRLTSTEAIIAQAKATYTTHGLCEAKATDADLYSQYMAERKIALSNYYTAYTQNIASSLLLDDEIIYHSIYAPVILASLTETRINAISTYSSVKSLDYYNDDTEASQSSEQEETNSKSSRSSNSYSMSYLKQYLGINDLINSVGSQGDGIKIGVIDEGQPDITYLRDLGLDDNLEMNSHVWYATQLRHPRRVLEIIHSIVPDADFYYTTYLFVNNSETYTLVEEIEWLISKNVDIINCNLDLSSQSPQGIYDNDSTYGSLAEYWDYISDEYDVTIIQCAGNWGLGADGNYTHFGICSGAMAYNIITVGNYNLKLGAIDVSSEYYEGTTWTNKPDVCAPGYILFADTLEANGTSYSSPIVAGVAALIISYYDSIILPNKVKSIICASCSQHNYSSNSINFKKYGAGVIDAYYVKQILVGEQRLSNYMEYEDTSHTYTLWFDNPDFSYMDIVLTFEKTFFEDIGHDIANLDLLLFDSDGNLITSSVSTKNNVEVLINIPTQSDYMILEIRQTETIPNTNITDTEDLSVPYSVAWKMH